MKRYKVHVILTIDAPSAEDAGLAAVPILQNRQCVPDMLVFEIDQRTGMAKPGTPWVVTDRRKDVMTA